MGCIVLLAIGALVCASFVLRDPRVAVFAAPLLPDQLVEVETRLAAWQIPFAPMSDNVRVAPQQRADILLRLALAGVPHPHLAGTAETFARAGALAPQTVLEAQTRDALSADLAQSLRGVAGVADARVIVAPASDGIYADQAEHAASASVRVRVLAGAHLSDATVAGIRAFIAGGVPGLAPERVTVLDDNGALNGASGEHDAQNIAHDLQSALDAAFGVGATIVRVHREELGEQRVTHDARETSLPGMVTRDTSEEHLDADKRHYLKSAAVERAGTERHAVDGVAQADATAHLSVAVFVDGARALELSKIRALAEATVGIDRARGDTLAVEAVRFSAPVLIPARGVDAWAIAGLAFGLIPQIALIGAAFGIACLAGRPFYRLTLRAIERLAVHRMPLSEQVALPPGRLHGALLGEPPYVAAAVISALPAATATAVLELYPPAERAQIVRRLARAAVGLVPAPEELLRERA